MTDKEITQSKLARKRRWLADRIRIIAGTPSRTCWAYEWRVNQ